MQLWISTPVWTGDRFQSGSMWLRWGSRLRWVVAGQFAFSQHCQHIQLVLPYRAERGL